ncbi:flippase [Candidatus Woesearchaeota archaeon]|nr:MAG: flippase [Candidatus Woesearchaeota archaeon]
MTTSRDILRGSLLIFLATGFAAAFSYAIRIYLARSFSINEYGLFYAVFTLISTLMLFRRAGLPPATIRFASQEIAKKNIKNANRIVSTSFFLQFSFGVLLAVLVIFLSPLLTKYYFETPVSEILLKSLSLFFITSLGIELVHQLLNIKQDSKTFAASVISKEVILFLLILLIPSKSLIAPSLAYVLCGVFVFLLFFRKAFRGFSWTVPDKYSAKKLLGLGKILLVTTIGSNIISNFDTLMLTKLSTYEQVGIYNIVLPTVMAIFTITNSLTVMALPTLVKRWEHGRREEIRKGFEFIYRLLMVFSLPFLFALGTYAKTFIAVFFGSQYTSGTPAMQILLLSIPFALLATLNKQALIAFDSPRKILFVESITAALNVILNLFLIPSFGIEGAAFATTISFIAMLFLTHLAIVKKIKFEFPWKSWTLTFIAGTFFLCILQLFHTQQWNIFFKLSTSIPLAFLTYLAIVLFMKIIQISELKWLMNLALKK